MLGFFFFLWVGFCGEHCVCLYSTFFHLFSCTFITPTKKTQQLLQDNLEQNVLTLTVFFTVQVICTAHPLMQSCGLKGVCCIISLR